MSEFNRQFLERLQVMLPAGNAVEQIEAILDRPDAEAYTQALEADVFLQVIKEAGWDQGVDLVPYASPEQVQGLIDLDVWRRERFIPTRLDRWLTALVEETTDERYKRVMRDMDPEVMILYLKERLQVIEPDEEGRIPDDAPEMATMSPDGMYVLVYPEDEDQRALCKRMLERLYELDRVLAWTMLEGVRWELQSELEEYALRWRTSRMEELGYVSLDEAMRVYATLDPVKLREQLEQETTSWMPASVPPTRRNLDLPAVVRSELDEEFLYVRLLSKLEDTERFHAKMVELSTLLNKVMIADGVEPGEVGSGRQVIRRALGYMSLGMEFLSRGDEELAVGQAERLPAREVFRTGVSLVARVQHQARQLVHRPTLTLIEGEPYSLLSEDDAALFEGLSRLRPTYGRSATAFELFESQDQLDEAALRLGMLAFKQLWIFAMQRISVGELVELVARPDRLGEPQDVTLDALFGTWLAREWIEGTPRVEPLSREEFAALLRAMHAPRSDAPIRERFAGLFSRYQALLPAGTDRLLERWIGQTLSRFEEEFGAAREEGGALPGGFPGVILLKR